jgi:GNAT superfamily N-acetyltransferase
MSIPTKTSPKEVFAPKPRMILRASRAAVADVLVLADGTRLRFRPLRSDDRDRLAGLFARLTLESRRRRFLSPKPALTTREVAFLTDIDHVPHEAIAAVDQRDGSIVGVARYVRVADRPGVADMAVEVVDEIQNMGVGTALAARVLDRARANGFTLLTATTLGRTGRRTHSCDGSDSAPARATGPRSSLSWSSSRRARASVPRLSNPEAATTAREADRHRHPSRSGCRSRSAGAHLSFATCETRLVVVRPVVGSRRFGVPGSREM